MPVGHICLKLCFRKTAIYIPTLALSKSGYGSGTYLPFSACLRKLPFCLYYYTTAQYAIQSDFSHSFENCTKKHALFTKLRGKNLCFSYIDLTPLQCYDGKNYMLKEAGG